MPGSVFFDTNILVYAFGTTDPRSIRAKELLAEGGAISVQVLNEFAAVARRRIGMDWSEVQRALSALRTVCSPILPLTLAMHGSAMTLAEQHGLHVYDAMIVSAAMAAGCKVLYSEDMQNGRSFPGGPTIRNPFS